MRKFKAVAVILLTLILLIAGAYIPRLVARFRDRQITGKGALHSIASVELHIYRDLSPVGKLAMMNRIDSLLPIRESKASMTGEEVMDAVYEALIPYTDIQLASYHENRVDMRPYLVQIPDMPELQRVIWQVTISGDDADFTFFDLILDDETGHILRISYTSEQPLDTIVGLDALHTFADIFFSGLGVEDHWAFAVSDMETAYVGDNANAVRFRFVDPQYGEIHVDLNVYDCGFYVEFPSVR